MRKSNLILFSILLSFIIISCSGTNLYLNKNYEYRPANKYIKLALIPAPCEYDTFIDSMFTYIFEDSLRNQDIVPPDQIRKSLREESDLLAVVNKLISLKHSKEELKSGINLKSLLSKEEYTLLSDQLGHPDIMLLPVSMGMNSSVLGTFGECKVRLFDIRDGSLIYQQSQNLNVNVSGENGKKILAIGLISFAKEDFDKHFWDKYVELNEAVL